MISSQNNFQLVLGICRDFKAVDLTDADLKKLVGFVCGRFYEDAPETIHFEVSIAIVDNVEITECNKQYLGKKEVTDCLSFDLSEPEQATKRVFEIIVNGQEALRQAEQRGHNAGAELALYIVHGLLHNFGFDDGSSCEAQRMHSEENNILQELGYGIVYNSGYQSR